MIMPGTYKRANFLFVFFIKCGSQRHICCTKQAEVLVSNYKILRQTVISVLEFSCWRSGVGKRAKVILGVQSDSIT
jgi:hypothetical protein